MSSSLQSSIICNPRAKSRTRRTPAGSAAVLVLGVASIAAVPTSQALLFTFSGFDAGATTVAGSPNALAQSAAFNAAIGGAFSTIDFSGLVGPDDALFLALPEAQLAPGVTISVTDGDPGSPDGVANLAGSPGIWGGTPSNWSQTSPQFITFGEAGTGEPASALTFNFANPVNFFGAFFYVDDGGAGEFVVNYNNGSPQSFDPPDVDGIGFLGFFDSMATVGSVEFRTDPVASSVNLGISIDDVTFGNVPEPSSVLLLGVGLALAALKLRKRDRT